MPLAGARVARWVSVPLLLVGAVVFVVQGADRPVDPFLRPPEGGGPPARTPVEGFASLSIRIDRTDVLFGGQSVEAARCALAADTPQQQARGLMGRTDLAGYDGMLFRFPADTTGTFFMKDTPMPLSIAFFDGSGRFVSAADMVPCLNRPSCPTYAATRPYRSALEVPQGRLADLGIGPGARLVAGGPCT